MELSEAINSMFKWYEKSDTCYAYLEDVGSSIDAGEKFESSRWFKRGWTLQELIAPREVVFYNRRWNLLGTRTSLAPKIHEITQIQITILLPEGNTIHEGRGRDARMGEYSVAERMSWAAHRETTREEDIAYSLMGMFGVNMPLLYGEGRNSFIRLQEEIIKRTPDQTIFAWEFEIDSGKRPENSYGELHSVHFFASSPYNFRNCHGINGIRTDRDKHLPTPHSLTCHGLEIELPVIKSNGSALLTGILNTSKSNGNSKTLFQGILLQVIHGHWETYHGNTYHRIGLETSQISTVSLDARAASEATIRRITIAFPSQKRLLDIKESELSEIVLNDQWSKSSGLSVTDVSWAPSLETSKVDMNQYWDRESKILSSPIDVFQHEGRLGIRFGGTQPGFMLVLSRYNGFGVYTRDRTLWNDKTQIEVSFHQHTRKVRKTSLAMENGKWDLEIAPTMKSVHGARIYVLNLIGRKSRW